MKKRKEDPTALSGILAKIETSIEAIKENQFHERLELETLEEMRAQLLERLKGIQKN